MGVGGQKEKNLGRDIETQDELILPTLKSIQFVFLSIYLPYYMPSYLSFIILVFIFSSQHHSLL